jgi:hypothetical protein
LPNFGGQNKQRRNKNHMREYQYYDFVAIDRPLTRNEMAELRSRSSRATITATSFVNNWGI